MAIVNLCYRGVVLKVPESFSPQDPIGPHKDCIRDVKYYSPVPESVNYQ